MGDVGVEHLVAGRGEGARDEGGLGGSGCSVVAAGGEDRAVLVAAVTAAALDF